METPSLWNMIRLIWFRPSVACAVLFTWLAFTRVPADGLSAAFFAGLACLTRPDWLRRIERTGPVSGMTRFRILDSCAT